MLDHIWFGFEVFGGFALGYVVVWTLIYIAAYIMDCDWFS